tara:strand:- start:21 stop:191 length:171 start_codon:yes stop_codon:yes gene_type:complete
MQSKGLADVHGCMDGKFSNIAECAFNLFKAEGLEAFEATSEINSVTRCYGSPVLKA